MKGVVFVLGVVMMNIVGGAEVKKGSSSVKAMFVLGDSSVDCGDNSLFYSLVRRNLSLHPCNGSDHTLLPHLLAEKIGLPYSAPFYNMTNSIEGLMSGINFGSAEATIMNSGNPIHQSLNQQLRQAFDTLELLHLQLGQDKASNFIQSSLFYLSFGKDDYINLFLSNSSATQKFARIIVGQMINAIRYLYDANVRRIVCAGILPLGCAPRTLWEGYFNTTGSDGEEDESGSCDSGINGLVLQYNTLLEQTIAELRRELGDAQIVFCDVYRAILELITNPVAYGFEDVRSACCGVGRYGGLTGCLSTDMACHNPSTHVWWDLYNPTPTVNSFIADSAWSGQPLPDICRPITVQKLIFS